MSQPCCPCPHDMFPMRCQCRCHVLAYCREMEMSPTEMLSFLIINQHLTLGYCGIGEEEAERILRATGWLSGAASAEF